MTYSSYYNTLVSTLLVIIPHLMSYHISITRCCLHRWIGRCLDHHVADQ
uniref:Uncharacterized protein n=1 Tax=Arundo donax TaxID=35708 RepID=A0A0A9GBQ1_ARUDO